MTKTKKIILIRERLWESVAKDLTTFGCMCASIAFGVWLQSGALQIIAGTMFVFFLLAKAMGEGKKNQMTMDEAINQIEQWKAEQ